MTNALAHESSPYLRQHAHNPVDWVPWGPDALRRARERNVPLLVSIGYSSCHWCHVMERESFEDERTARLMNDGFVCVKVDREERPDVDALYMEAVQGMTGHGGWPLNVFLTPEGLPFYGGTYFPPDDRPGMPSFSSVLLAISEAWTERGQEIRTSSEQLRERLAGGALLDPSAETIDVSALEGAVERLRQSFDSVNGGFGGAPKFPQASVLEFLMCRAGDPRELPAAGSSPPASSAPASPDSASSATPVSPNSASAAAQMALYTLRSMAGGGIHDQVGGGFHRYAVDPTWTVPHFEKMLYDNALLARAYLHGSQLAGDRELLEVCLDTLGWTMREMRGPEGGFYSALDADSDEVEGRFYVWTIAELQDLLYPTDATDAIAWLGASEQGNFVDPHHPQPGLNVLEDRGPRPDRETRRRIRGRLLEARELRTRPGLDDKRLTSWNALMITALAETGAHLRADPREQADTELGQSLLDAATGCAEFLLRELRDERGALLRTYNSATAKIGAYLEDYAYLLEALLALFEASCEERWLTHAVNLADELIARFSDAERGGFFSTAADGEQLIVRRKELDDSPIPAGASSAALGLGRLAQLTGNEEYRRQSMGVPALAGEIAVRHPGSFGHLLQAIHWQLSPMRPIACAIPRQ